MIDKITLKSIRLNFIIDLRDFNLESHRRMYGPAFHRFLPNNKYDKLEKNLSSLTGKISFWFERRGIMDDNLIRYNNKKKLINENAILKQGILDGGPLFGQIILNEVSSDVLKVLQNNLIGDPNYISFGKKIVKEITEQSTVLINILRELYRQYWVSSIDHWDSRTHSLGSYCKDNLSLEYSLNNGQTWHKFIPDAERNEIHLESIISLDFSDFISKNDWVEI